MLQAGRKGAVAVAVAASATTRARVAAVGRTTRAAWRLGQTRSHGDAPDPNAPKVSLVFVRRDGTEARVVASAGQDLLRVAQANDLEVEGACEGSVACSTCHVILEKKTYDALPPASESEEDMLDMAFGLTGTSRLGCQVKVTTDMEGTRVTIPKATRNMYVDGHKPKPH